MAKEGDKNLYTVFMLCVGPELPKVFHISENIIASPAGFLGTTYPQFLADFVSKFLGPEIEFEVHQAPLVPPEKSEPVIKLEIKVEAVDHQEAIENAYPILEKARDALATGYSSSIQPFGAISIYGTVGFLKTEVPKETGLDWVFPEGGNNYPHEASVAINAALSEDLRLEHLVDLYHQAMGTNHADLQVSMLFLTLEAIVSTINKQMGGNRSKNAIMLDLEYNEQNLPLFQIGNNAPQQINHIDLAYEIRNSFFHGGRDHSRNIPEKIKIALEIYKEAPELFALALAYDCWKALYLWAKKTSKAYKAWSGETISLERPIPVQGSYFRMHYIARERPSEGAAGIMIRPGEKSGQVYFVFIIRFRSNRVSLQIEAPADKDPNASAEYPLGYKLVLP